MSSVRVAVINTEDAAIWSPVTFADMFVSLLSAEGEQWHIFNLLPETTDLPNIDSYDAFVITGSHYDVRDCGHLAWFVPLCTLIQHVAKNPSKRMYAGCYGCQIVAHALGGAVDYNSDKKLYLGVKNIKLLPEFTSLAATDKRQEVSLIVAHGDCVSSLPAGSTLLASSEQTQHEVFTCGAGQNILACQSHPEFDYAYAIRDKIWPQTLAKDGGACIANKENALAALEAFNDCDAKYMCAVIRSFLLQK